MRKRYCISFLFYSIVCWGQYYRFIYEYKYIADLSTKKYSSEIMFLDTSDSNSLFYSVNNFKEDSIFSSEKQKGLFSMPPITKFIDYQIAKNQDSIIMYKNFDGIPYTIKELSKFKWKIYKEKLNINQYNTQKATTIYEGREWTAYFVTTIPINEGPYKFNGLPGLIIRLYDNTSTHIFDLVKIKSISKKTIYPKIYNKKSIEISNVDYRKIFNEYLKDPLKKERLNILNNWDLEDGETPSQLLKEVEKATVDRLKKYSNTIEIYK